MREQAFIQEATNRKNLLLLVLLRWFAVIGQVAAIAVAYLWLGFHMSLPSMGGVILFLIGLNIAALARLRRVTPVTDLELLGGLLLDVIALTVQLYLSGGATNPFISLFLLQTILGAVLLRSWSSWMIVAVASACYVGLMLFYHDVGLLADMAAEGTDTFSNLHVLGSFVCFLLAAILLVAFVTRINRNLREQDLRLAELRQRSAEEGHVVRLGLLASGAAHELGTPLSTIAVILNDWQRMPVMRDVPDLAHDLSEIQEQLARCKEIVSSVLRSSGEERGEGAARCGVIAFFNDAVVEWQRIRAPVNFTFDNQIEPDITIVSDILLRQVLFNVLDNALEASPGEINVQLLQDRDSLVIVVCDTGSGFSAEVLADIGKPYQSTKGQPGRGLGLFLVVNVLRKLGGHVVTANRPTGGAIVELHIPISALAVAGSHGG